MQSTNRAQPLLLCFEDDTLRGTKIAEAGDLAIGVIEQHRFPDGEIKLRLPKTLPDRTIILRSLNNPNEKLIALLLAAHAARDLGAKHLTLVAPYLAYMRQDIAFQAGEAISQHAVGGFLAHLFDALITVDPHLHRVASLQEAVPVSEAITLSGAPLLSDLIASHRTNPLLMGPDDESAPWIAQAALRHGFDHAVCRKIRHGDRDVEITLPDWPVSERQVVLLDDVASTGHTIAQATRLLLAAGARTVDMAVTHALFAGNALALIQEAGVDKIWSTDCIIHPSNAVSMAAPIAQALARLHRPWS